MKKILRLNTVIIVLFFLASLSVNAQNRGLAPDDLFKIKSVGETAFSPDGKMIAYTLNVPRPLNEEPGSNYNNLYVYNVEDQQSVGLLANKISVSSIQWDTESEKIYFLGKIGEQKTNQVYYIDSDGGSPKLVTTEQTDVLAYKISPDGQKIAFIRLEDKSKGKQEMLSRGFDAEIYEEEFQHRNLYVMNLNDKSVKQITTASSVFEFEWSSDSRNIAAAIADKNLVDDSYMFKRLYVIDSETGIKYKLVDNPGKLTQFSFSPDGTKLAFVSASSVNDAVSGSLFVCDVPNTKQFSQLKNYSEGFEGSVIMVRWKDDNTLIFSSEEGVDITLREQKINEKSSKLLLEPGKVVLRNFDLLNNDVCFAGNTKEHPNELFVFNLEEKNLIKLTNHNNWLSVVKLAKQEKIEFPAKDGLKIQGVLIYPLNYEQGKKYPLITYIHGGPEAAVQNGWETGYGSWGQFAAAKDFFVFMPNYRASSGRGVEFTMMGFGDLAGKEFEDVIDGIDYLIQQGLVDKNKVGIGGGSYGGYFSAWAATKYTDRFAASVVFVGISNQISKRNTTDIPYEDYYVHWGFWTHENEQLVWERSPVRYAHQSKTPTLILHGKEDPRVHPSQSLELYRALKLHGKAPVRLVFYPGQGHGNSKNTSRYDYLVRTLDWFEYYLKSGYPKDRLPAKYLEFD
ncbi:S9 family peptidase [Ignavibacterium sp.]|uniref:S9 family peptidase n=1 Tax=Ignavibacterium sp. TaxID=2651167 RepID=UPI002201FF86|nr:S9 family peptidase [Ignavibacterium sp.]BDQ04091.1 MAG: prolyl oligopeptidase [Ignavibacterium sp.]